MAPRLHFFLLLEFVLQVKSGSPAKTYPGPVNQSSTAQWLAELYTLRAQWREQTNYSSEVYDDYLPWSPAMFIAPQSHIYDSFLYDPVEGWTVDRFLDDLESRYGGIDGVLLWCTYPNLGVDERSQFDLLEDLPGGLAEFKNVVAQFNKRGVHVGLPYNPWDTGTARRSKDDPTVLGELAAAVGAEFANGDTMALMPSEFWSKSVAAGAPLALEPEGGGVLESVAWTKMGWGYWSPDPIPQIDTWKWLEHRHISHICNRWNTAHTIDLQQAFFNGIGFVSWESVWGCWNGLSLFDAEATRRVGSLLRFLAPFFTAPTWTPHTLLTPEAYAAAIFASRWVLPGGVPPSSPYSHNSTAYTLVNKGKSSWDGATLPVPCSDPSTEYFDLYAGKVLPPPVPSSDGGCALSLYLEVGGYSAVLGLSAGDVSPSPPAALTDFLAKMSEMTARPLSTFSTSPTLLEQEMTFIQPAPMSAAPPGTVLIPGKSVWRFSVSGTEIEGRTVAGNDVQFPWESVASTSHAPHHLQVPNLYVDVTPVTNDAYAAFLASSHYIPTDTHNFLRDWTPGSAAGDPPSVPPGWGNKPVTWVDLRDARAFCVAAGKRLPHDWEWQYVAEDGVPGKLYPWGSTPDPSRYPPQNHSTTRPPPPDVGSFPSGDTPSGVKDLMGNVWQWTDEFSDAHTRVGLVRGGSYYTAVGSMWYFPNNLLDTSARGVNVQTHNKLLLMAPSYDRHGTVGFRCVADAPGFPPPPPPQPPAGCADGTCDAFCDNQFVQGCSAYLTLGTSMRDPRTGKPCGGAGAPCAAPADACAQGWEPCLGDFSVPALSGDGFRAVMTAANCSAGDSGRFIAAMSHADCAHCAATPTSKDITCKALGCGAEAVCCGSACVLAGCKTGVYPNATTIYDDQSHGCGFVAPGVADGVLCCKVSA